MIWVVSAQDFLLRQYFDLEVFVHFSTESTILNRHAFLGGKELVGSLCNLVFSSGSDRSDSMNGQKIWCLPVQSVYWWRNLSIRCNRLRSFYYITSSSWELFILLKLPDCSLLCSKQILPSFEISSRVCRSLVSLKTPALLQHLLYCVSLSTMYTLQTAFQFALWICLRLLVLVFSYPHDEKKFQTKLLGSLFKILYLPETPRALKSQLQLRSLRKPAFQYYAMEFKSFKVSFGCSDEAQSSKPLIFLHKFHSQQMWRWWCTSKATAFGHLPLCC